MTKTVFWLSIVAIATVLIAGSLAVSPIAIADDDDDDDDERILITTTILDGLGAGALYPYIDTTPNLIESGHIAITDETADCDGDDANEPSNIAIVVGSVGGTFVESKELGLGLNFALDNVGVGGTGQCVFHFSFEADDGTFPEEITDIVVVNTDSSALTGKNTITASIVMD